MKTRRYVRAAFIWLLGTLGWTYGAYTGMHYHTVAMAINVLAIVLSAFCVVCMGLCIYGAIYFRKED